MLASLNHPNIASIYGLEESGGVRALVMELVEGPTLAERIKSGPMELDEALPGSTPPMIRSLLTRTLAEEPRQRLQAIGEARIVIEETLGGNADVGAGLADSKAGQTTDVEQLRSRFGLAK